MGLDLGEKTIGMAISDPAWHVASPLATIRRSQWKKDYLELEAKWREREIKALIVGWPLNMDGSQGQRCQSTRQFCNNILKLKDIPILLWDERLSTRAVENLMIEADLSRARRAQSVDKMAASYILQGALDRLRRER